MKVKVALLVTAVNILRTIDTTAMKLSASYKVRNVLAIGQEAILDFEAKRIALAEKHGTLNEAGEKYDFKTDKDGQKFQDELNEMLEDEVELDIVKIPVEMVDDYITIAPVNIPYVEWFISGLD